MHEARIRTFADLHQVVCGHGLGWIYRGQPEADWALVPGIGRQSELMAVERELFAAWKRGAVQFVDPPPPSDWDWMAIAQHHGLATRLLDWTGNPLAAAFFACCHQGSDDAVIWAFAPGQTAEPAADPFAAEGVLLVRPGAHAARIARQGAAFTIHGPPDIRIDERHGALHKLVVDAGYRDRLLEELSRYGYNHATLFPDLDGLSRFLNWQAASGRL